MNTENSNIQSTPIASKNVEKFSFFQTAKVELATEISGNIDQLLTHLRTNTAWKHKIEALRSLRGDALQKAKTNLPAFTASCYLPNRKRVITADSNFEHTNLIQADFDEAEDFDELYALVKTCLLYTSPSPRD